MLQAAISGEPEFGKDNRWAAEDRPKKLAKLIRDHLGSIPEADTIRKILKNARSLRSGASARPVAPAPRAARRRTAEQRDELAAPHGFLLRFRRRKAVILPD